MVTQGTYTVGSALFILFVLSSLLFPSIGTAKFVEEEAFNHWVAEFRTEALERGFSEDFLDAALRNLRRLPRVIELDQRQPETVETLREYLGRRITPPLIRRGRLLLDNHAELLRAVYEKYGVEPRFIVALWGIESRFGDNQGTYPVLSSLATLAHEGRREQLFRNELFQALKIIEAGHVSPDRFLGSWAGAMGQCQFLPSSFIAYAVDFDGSGTIDIWHSLPDVFGSIANYLVQHGWEDQTNWGFSVNVPADAPHGTWHFEKRQSVEKWAHQGLHIPDTIDADRLRDRPAALVVPTGDDQGYLVFNNYEVFRRWNRSHHFAIAVGTLADSLKVRAEHDGQPPR